MLFSFLRTNAQGTEALSGRVILPNGVAVSQAIVRLEGTSFHDHTNDSGKFYINDIPIGTYQLTVNRIGFSPTSTIVTLKNGRTTEISITVKERAVIVSEVVVTGTRTEKELSDDPNDACLTERYQITKRCSP